MIPADMWNWRIMFRQQLTDTSELLCPVCEEWASAKDWTVGSAYCSDCQDDHVTVICPNCDCENDSVFDDALEVREPAPESYYFGDYE